MGDAAAKVIVTTEDALREIIREELNAHESSNILTADQAAAMIKCSVGHVQKMAREGLLPAHNIAMTGTEWRFHRTEIDQWILQRDTKPLKEAG